MDITRWSVQISDWLYFLKPKMEKFYTESKNKTTTGERHKRHGLDTWVGKIPLEKGMATNSSTPAWRIPWTKRSLAGYSPWGCKESDDWSNQHAHTPHHLSLIFVQEYTDLWERARLGWYGRMALKHVSYHMWNKLPVQVRCIIQGARGWCTGITQRDEIGREVGGGFRMGSTCTPMADS